MELQLTLVMHPPADTAVSPAAIKVKIFTFKGMAALAMRLRALFSRMGGNGLLLRLCVIPERLFGKDLFRRPALRDAPVESPRVDPGLVGQLRYMHGFTAKANDTFRAHVAALFFRCSPSAILWAVIAVGVFAFKRVSVRAWRHVFYEGPKGCTPALAYRNSPPTIVMKSDVLWIVAALKHLCPSAIKWMFCFEHDAIVSPYVTGGQ